MKIATRICICLMPIILAACSSKGASVTSQDKKSLAAKSIPPLRMPPGAASSSFKNYYPVSSREYPGQDTPVNLVPPGLYTDTGSGLTS